MSVDFDLGVEEKKQDWSEYQIPNPSDLEAERLKIIKVKAVEKYSTTIVVYTNSQG